MALDPDDENWTTLEYARRYELTRKYDNDGISYGGLPVPTDDWFEWSFGFPSDANIMDSVTTLTKERLAVSKEAAVLLRAVHDLQQAPAVQEPVADHYEWVRSLKQELPILKTDNELDLLSFGSHAMPASKDMKMPSEALDEENDEGLEWPTKYMTYPAQYDRQIKAEKLAVSREVLLHLQDALADRFTAEDAEELVEQSLQRKMNTARQPVTPPLLPMSPPITPYIPSSPANRLPLASSSSDSVQAELTVLEQQIMGADSLQRLSSDDSMLLDCVNPPNLSSSPRERNPIIPKRRAEDLKVEGPLTPPMFSGSPMKKLKSVTFSDGLQQIIPEASWALADDGDESEPDFDELFKDLEPYATEARRRVETERLAGADTTARVDVPLLDFRLPVAPWNEYSRTTGESYSLKGIELDAQMQFLRRVKREDLKNATSWHGVSSLERSLKWGILLAKVSKIDLDEQLHGESEATKMLADVASAEVATSSTQVWKQEGVRLLDLDEEEEEIEVAEVEEHTDVEALVRKRKLILEEETQEVPTKRTMSQSQTHSKHPSGEVSQSLIELAFRRHHVTARSATMGSYPDRATQTAASQPMARGASAQGRNDLMFGGFSATSALHKFMETQGRAIEALQQGSTDSGRSTQQSRVVPERPTSDSVHHNATTTKQPRPETTVANEYRSGAPSSRIPLPALPSNLAPCTFIVSSVFLRQRNFIRSIEQLYKEADLIYRDYERPHSSIDEADIVLSPSTGLILTTLQQIKQRPLPGQPDRSPLKERMRKLQKRYERLVVVVGEALSPDMEEQGSSRPEDARDKESLTLLKTFAETLEGDVLIKYVPGGDQALARYIVGEMAAYGLPHGSQDIGDIKLVPVETTWEVFLRQVGLNPFAAQVIVASLKESFDLQLPGSTNKTMSIAGLSAFVLMGEEMRMRYFQTSMGGSRILKSVSRVLDQEWVSAAHGFRIR